MNPRQRRIADDLKRYPLDPPGYMERVRELEEQGMTTSDAQGGADAEILTGGLRLGENTHCVVITVEGGCVTDVDGLPDGWCYEIDDRD